MNGACSIKGIDDVAEEMYLIEDYFGQAITDCGLIPLNTREDEQSP